MEDYEFIFIAQHFLLDVIYKDSPPGQVSHPDIERSEIIGKGWHRGEARSDSTSVPGWWILSQQNIVIEECIFPVDELFKLFHHPVSLSL